MWLIWTGFLFSGCVSDGGSTLSALGACPEDAFEGSRCEADREVACAVRGSDRVCRCERSADGSAEGVIVCDSAGGTDPGTAFCREHVHTGDVCDPTVDSVCHHACDGDVYCRCTPTGDATDPAGSEADRAAHVWLCDDGSVPPPGGTTCDDGFLELCRSGAGPTDPVCIAEDGRRCYCARTEAGSDGDPSDPGSTGGVGIVCDPPPPPPPSRECTDVDLERCRAGEWVECVSGDAICHCEWATDPVPGSGETGAILVCSPGGGTTPPPSPPPCRTDAGAIACDSSTGGVCSLPDGTLCECTADGGLRCTTPPVPEPGSICGADADERCARGEDVRCASADGVECACLSGSDGRRAIYCGL
jgi:hypothetical protein